MLEGIYEEVINSAALIKVLDKVIVSLTQLEIETLWTSLFPDHIVNLIRATRDALDKNIDVMTDNGIQGKIC